MKCKRCQDEGRLYMPGKFIKCPDCQAVSNEEWFINLPTEEKAKTIVCLEVNALHKWKKGLVESDVDEIKRWLKEKKE